MLSGGPRGRAHPTPRTPHTHVRASPLRVVGTPSWRRSYHTQGHVMVLRAPPCSWVAAPPRSLRVSPGLRLPPPLRALPSTPAVLFSPLPAAGSASQTTSGRKKGMYFFPKHSVAPRMESFSDGETQARPSRPLTVGRDTRAAAGARSAHSCAWKRALCYLSTKADCVQTRILRLGT